MGCTMSESLEELQEKEHHFKHALEMVKLGYWYWVPTTNELYWSRECYNLLGHDPDNTLAPNLELFFSNIESSDHEHVQGMLKKVSEEGSAPDLEYRVNLPGSKTINVIARAEVIKNPDGSPKYLFGTLQDNTENKSQKVQLQEALKKAEVANETKSEFLACISHEFRTPLNAIIGYSQLLMLADLNEKQKRNIKDVINAGELILEMINNVLNFSAINSKDFKIQKESLDLSAIIAECIALTTPVAQQYSIELKTDTDQQRPKEICSDKIRLKLALINIITNAIKYNKPGGYVSVSVEEDNENTKIIIKDNGIGIRLEKQKELFKTFDRLGKERGAIPGAGIGLAIVKRSIEAISGKIEVESKEGKGSVFTLFIPKL